MQKKREIIIQLLYSTNIYSRGWAKQEPGAKNVNRINNICSKNSTT